MCWVVHLSSNSEKWVQMKVYRNPHQTCNSPGDCCWQGDNPRYVSYSTNKTWTQKHWYVVKWCVGKHLLVRLSTSRWWLERSMFPPIHDGFGVQLIGEHFVRWVLWKRELDREDTYFWLLEWISGRRNLFCYERRKTCKQHVSKQSNFEGLWFKMISNCLRMIIDLTLNSPICQKNDLWGGGIDDSRPAKCSQIPWSPEVQKRLSQNYRTFYRTRTSTTDFCACLDVFWSCFSLLILWICLKQVGPPH